MIPHPRACYEVVIELDSCWSGICIQRGVTGRGVRAGYGSDETDEEWAFMLPYLLLCREDAGIGSMIWY